MSEKRVLWDLSLAELEAYIAELGQPKYRAEQIYRSIMRGDLPNEMTTLPQTLRDSLSRSFNDPPIIENTYPSKDGSVKLLYRLYDGNLIEGVYMPHSYGISLCLSTQVGCRMGCAFCASGIDGLERNLSAGEMLGQITAVNKYFAPKNVSSIVLMGSGEPLDNYDNVIRFLTAVTDPKGLNLSRRNISLSTCGIPDKIRALAATGLDVTLSISLHATVDEIRQEIMPIAKRFTIAEVVDAAKEYFRKTGRRVIYEYAMIKGKNMHFLDAKRLREITGGYPAHLNLIMLNPVKEKHLQGCSRQEAETFRKRLQDNGVSVTIRKSMGSDVVGACGQLRRAKRND